VIRSAAGRWLPALVVPLVLAGLWLWGGRADGIKGDIFPAPWEVAKAIADLFTQDNLLHDVVVTAKEILFGFAIAAGIGLSAGLVLGRTRFVLAVLEPFLTAAYSVPKIIVFPIMLIVFGISTKSKVAMGVVHGVFPMLMTTIAGVRGVDRRYLMLADSLNATRPQRVFKFLLPAIRRPVVTGLRLTLTLTVIGVITGELLQSNAGLGHVVYHRYSLFDFSGMIGAIVVLLAFVQLLQSAITRIERRYR
jgi:NitT/TauT family transport system permease protein